MSTVTEVVGAMLMVIDVEGRKGWWDVRFDNFFWWFFSCALLSCFALSTLFLSFPISVFLGLHGSYLFCLSFTFPFLTFPFLLFSFTLIFVSHFLACSCHEKTPQMFTFTFTFTLTLKFTFTKPAPTGPQNIRKTQNDIQRPPAQETKIQRSK